jgi:hypothetical protein
MVFATERAEEEPHGQRCALVPAEIRSHSLSEGILIPSLSAYSTASSRFIKVAGCVAPIEPQAAQ